MGLKLPKDWNDVTVEQFQECYFLLGKTPTIDTWVMVLSTLSGKPGSEIEALSITDLKKYIKKLDFLINPNLNEKVNKFVSIKGKIFKAVYQASDMQTNQVADLKGLMNSEGQSINDTVVENAHKLLACIYVPLTLKGFRYLPSKHKEVSNSFRKAKMGEVYGTLFFYSKTYKALMEAINSYGEKNLEIVKEHMKEIEDWQTRRKILEKDGVGK
jgi:hypothetical protein